MNLHISNELLAFLGGLLSFIGVILGFLLHKNAAFIKDLVDTINGIKNEFTELLANSKATRERVHDIEESRKMDKQTFIPIMNENRQRIVVLEKRMDDQDEEIEKLREAKHGHANQITSLGVKIVALERDRNV